MDTTGLIVVAAILVLGTVAGLWRRRTDGRFSSVGVSAGGTGGVRVAESSPAAGTPGGTASAGSPSAGSALAGSASGELAGGGPGTGATGPSDRVPGAGDLSDGDPSAAGRRIDPALLEKLGVVPAQATLLQFSSAFCAPCRAVRRVSGEVADLIPGVRHVEVDAESHLDAVRALGIWRTPTLLVLDAEGRVAKRATGVPAKAQLIAVLGDVLPAA